ncbi:Sugar fermentation stimulation protein [Arthrobacter alpinus]|uniref:Sugar fermentation stimulation protein n=1 Tax=Arthrobacter alpinus TaxID=656366 RepID=A0A1H5IRM1_9MICC|nr:DNA/RNA nuclease SfsA [Arthrobacter alpinus]SEE42754.1 Sugar fermentation stimulation protein [Arthrobacter alpinus]
MIDNTIAFPEELLFGTIIRRPNRFIIAAEINGEQFSCHCPTTGRIGNLVLDDLQGLLSLSRNPQRKTPFTVEAISVDPPERADDDRLWIGINQNAANRLVGRVLSAHLLPGIVTPTLVEREKKLGDSRLDFLVDGKTFIEVKTPLQSLQIDLGEHSRTTKTTPFDSTDRFV